MDQAHRRIAAGRCVHGKAAPDKPAALHQIVSLLEFFQKQRHTFHRVLVVAVHSQNALIAAPQRIVQAHAQLCTLFAGPQLGKQRVHAALCQAVFLHTAVGAAAVTQNHIAQLVHARLLNAVQLGENALAFVDNGDQQAIFRLFFCKLLFAVIRHAGHAVDQFYTHKNTSAV